MFINKEILVKYTLKERINSECILLKWVTVVILTSSLIGCGRQEGGFIKNETGKEVRIELGLNDISSDPVKYLLADAIHGNSSSNHKYNGINKYVISYDSLTNTLTFKLGPSQYLNLGTVRLDKTRDQISDWEFNTIEARGEGIEIKAYGSEIMNLVVKEKSWFSQNSHYLVLK